ncbi:VacJ family lipoprotein [Marinimicrobium sp. ABcell2]|uniref:MlaA family lipoprotein n=1 Tax=Marinimicrobium sp. ABcell2 TaxID=3069751 RepID=UPI0027B57046|nr:VacJ family lipoprotein [Marinimicrobium sp. ABcell2]MDQ2076788.1 VacJ family lipoprotein [Marinimicrobium sp. ABcell2]
MLVFVAVLAGGCASLEDDFAATADESSDHPDDIEPTVVAYREFRDPLEPVNRAVFAFNDVSYRYVFVPLARGYNRRVPAPVRQGFSNFFDNLQAPVHLINNLLQLEPRAAGANVARFGINTTVGILGFFDPADNWFGIEPADASLDDTLAKYGAGYGFYVVVPFLGPSSLRAGTSALVEGYFHPISYIVTDDGERIVIQGFDYFQDFAPEADGYVKMVEESDDPYLFIRNFYLQTIMRDAEFKFDDDNEDEDEQEE